jgi:hypothetical protein
MTEGQFDVNKTTLPWAREADKMADKSQRQIWLTHAALESFAACEEKIPKEFIDEAISIALRTSALKQSEDGAYVIKSGDWGNLIDVLMRKLWRCQPNSGILRS